MNDTAALVAVGLAANVAVIVWAYRRRDWHDGLDWHDDIDDTGAPARYSPAMSDDPTVPNPDAPADPDADPTAPADPDSPDVDD